MVTECLVGQSSANNLMPPAVDVPSPAPCPSARPHSMSISSPGSAAVAAALSRSFGGIPGTLGFKFATDGAPEPPQALRRPPLHVPGSSRAKTNPLSLAITLRTVHVPEDVAGNEYLLRSFAAPMTSLQSTILDRGNMSGVPDAPHHRAGGMLATERQAGVCAGGEASMLALPHLYKPGRG